MERPEKASHDTILDEPYQGPSVTTAIAGEGYIAHFQWALIGLLSGGIASVVFHKHVNGAVSAIRKGSEAWREAGGIKNAFGSVGGWIFGRGEKEFVSIKNAIINAGPLDHYGHEALMTLESKEKGIGHWLADHAIPFMSKEKKRALIAKDGRYEAAAIGGGLLGSLGFFFSPLFFAHAGYRKGVAGKDQFARAQAEITTIRAERDDLLDKYAEVKTELATLKSEPALKVAADTPPSIEPVRDDAVAALARQDQKDSPVSISKPKIEGPPIQAPTIQGPTIESPIPKNQWWDGKEHGPTHAERLAARDAEAAQHEVLR